MLLFNLTLGNIFLYYLVIFIFPFLLYKGKIKINTFIISFAVIFGFFHFFYWREIAGQNYVAYVKVIENNGIPYFNYPQNSMPGYFMFAYFLKNFLFLKPEFIQKFIRFFIYLLMLFGIRDLAEFVVKKYTLNKKLITYAILIFAIDWNTNFLLIGNQFRNAFGQVLYIFFILCLLKKDKLKYILIGIATMIFHKMFILIVPITFLLFKSLELIKKISRQRLFFIFPIGIIFGVKIFQFLIRDYFNVFGFGDKLHHPGPTGMDALSIGVVVAIIFYGFIIVLSYRYFTDITKKNILFFCLTFFFFSFVISKVNILGINFVEPNRIYGLFMPYLAILFAYLLLKMENKLVVLVLFLYILYNFTLINFSKQTYAPTLQLIGNSIFNFVKIYFNNDISQMLLGLFYFLISVPIINVINKNRFIFSMFSVLNVILFFISYLVGIKGLSISVFYLMLFSIWPNNIKENSVFSNILFNIALFSLWEVSYLFFNKIFINVELNEIIFNSLLIWALMVLCWNLFISSGHLIKLKKVQYG